MDINVKTLRRDLAQYLKRAESGEEVTITRNGQVVAKLVPTHLPGRIDLEALHEHQQRLGVRLDHNPVLAARAEERY